MTKIKICGLQRIEDVEAVNKYLPDFIGFILTPGFRRSISRETAKKLKSALSPKIKAVGVFVNDDAENINSFVQSGIIDMVQLHGSESPEFCAAINAPVIKCFNCSGGVSENIGNYKADYLLFDSGTGTGKAFDWKNIPKTDLPFFLAGGISADNLSAAVAAVHPFAVDLSSAAETGGYKDEEKIKKIMEIVRNE